MPDDQSEKIIKLLEEIRDLTRERNGKFEEYIKIARERNEKYEEALRQREKAHERALRARRRFLWVLTPLLLLAIGFMIYLAFWVIPGETEKQNEQQLQESDDSNEFTGNAALNRRSRRQEALIYPWDCSFDFALAVFRDVAQFCGQVATSYAITFRTASRPDNTRA